VTTRLGASAPDRLLGVHLNMPLAFPKADHLENLTETEQATMKAMDYHRQFGSAYSDLQRTRPQTLGYGLADSPLGQAAWIYEKFREWSDCGDDPTNSFTLDEMLDDIMLYWLSNSGTSSARLYWESVARFSLGEIVVPIGVSVFRKEIFRSSRRWGERRYGEHLIYWNDVDCGGHFAAFEAPGAFVDEVRSCFRLLRRG
jgi:pimeloyl-ACP methyl ester carboxylesterase